MEHFINGLTPPVFLPIKLFPSCCANNSALIAKKVSIAVLLDPDDDSIDEDGREKSNNDGEDRSMKNLT